MKILKSLTPAITLGVLTLSTLTANAQNALQAGDLVISQVAGDGTSSSAAAVSLIEYNVNGTLQQAIAFNSNTANGTALTSSGSAGSEGALTLSADGKSLSYIGYNATAGTSSVKGTTSSATNRVIGTLGLNGTVTYSRLTDAYSGDNARSVVSTDGTAFYTGGANGGTASSAGVRYSTFSSTGTTSTVLSDTTKGSSSNIRDVNIFNGNLYYSTGSAANSGTVGIYQLGTGLPTSGVQTATLIVATPGASPSPYDFYFADANTLYVTDDRTNASGGLLKYTKSGGSFSLTATYNFANAANTGLAGLRGLTGTVDQSGNNVLFGVSTDNRLLRINDFGAIGVYATTVITGTSTGQIRGVEFLPGGAPLVTQTPAPSSLLVALAGVPGIGLMIRRRRKAAK